MALVVAVVVFYTPPQSLHKHVVQPRPRPAQLAVTSASARRPVYSRYINRPRWSVLRISGLPHNNSSASASRRDPCPVMFDSRYESTYRLSKSITAVRYVRPCVIGTCVMSELGNSST